MRRKLACGLFLIIAAGCGRVDLHHDLSEGNADEILVLLSNNGIDARKSKEVVQQRTTWKVSVSARHASRARELLLQHNLPRQRELGLAEVYKDKGLIPSPDEQKARFLLALKGEIINSLERMPSVIDADVVLNVPDQPTFVEEKVQRPTASVILRARKGNEPIREDKIQQFVANAIEGMDPRDVAVIVSYIGSSQDTSPDTVGGPAVMTEPPSAAEGGVSLIQVGGLRLDAVSAQRFKLYAGLVLFLLILVSVGLVYAVFRLTRLKTTSAGFPEQNRALRGGAVEALPAGGSEGIGSGGASGG